MGAVARCLVVGSLVAAACSSATPTRSASSITLAATTDLSTTADTGQVAEVLRLNCDEVIATMTEPDEGTEVVLGVVALQTAAAAPIALQTQAQRPGDPRLRLWAKSGLLVAGGAELAMEVPASQRGRLALGWGSPAHMAQRVEVAGCGSRGQWLAFAGGFSGAQVGCLPVDVVTVDATRTVMIGFGAPCPRQQAPPEPTDT
jgi:hypothetical protein